MSYTTHKQRKIGKAVLTVVVIFVLAIIAIMVAGCSTPAASTPDPAASSATTPEEAEPVDDGSYSFGETATFEDGVSFSVSEPATFAPSETAMGQVDGQQFLVFEFVATNNSDENLEPSLILATASSGGEEAAGIFDTEQSIGFPPATTVLPGATIKWKQAFSVVDPSNITLEVNIGFDKTAIFTN